MSIPRPHRNALNAAATLLAAFVAGCEPAPSPPPAPASAVPSADTPQVSITFNGKPAAEIPTTGLAERVTLASLLDDAPPSSWKLLTAQSATGARFQIKEPHKRLRDRDVSFFVGPKGATGIGVFRTVPPDAGAPLKRLAERPSLFVHSVDEVAVWTVEPPAPKVLPQPKGAPMRVVGEDRTIEINEPFLTRQPQVGKAQVLHVLAAGRRGPVKEKRHVHRGWTLRRVVKSLVKPRDVAKVTMTGRKGRVLVVDGNVIADKSTAKRRLLLLNDRKVLNYNGLADNVDLDAGQRPIERVRDIVKIEIERR